MSLFGYNTRSQIAEKWLGKASRLSLFLFRHLPLPLFSLFFSPLNYEKLPWARNGRRLCRKLAEIGVPCSLPQHDVIFEKQISVVLLKSTGDGKLTLKRAQNTRTACFGHEIAAEKAAH